MVDRDVFERRLAYLELTLRDLRRLAELERATFLTDRGLQAQAERRLEVAAECCIDLANHLIASRGWDTPETYRDAFRILTRQGVLSPELGLTPEGWAGLRNVLAHLYFDLDHARLWTVLQDELDDLADYARAIAGVTCDDLDQRA